jgi:hypothetical protein
MCCDASTSTMPRGLPKASTWLVAILQSNFPPSLMPSLANRPFALRTTAEATATLDDLVPSTTYYVTLRTHPASEPTIAWAPGWSAFSETVVCKTTAAPAGT